MRFMGSVQSSQDVCVKFHKKSVLFQRDTSRISKDVHEFLGFIGHHQMLTQHIFGFYSPGSSNCSSQDQQGIHQSLWRLSGVRICLWWTA